MAACEPYRPRVKAVQSTLDDTWVRGREGALGLASFQLMLYLLSSMAFDKGELVCNIPSPATLLDGLFSVS